MKTPYKEDDKTAFEDRKNILDGDKDINNIPIEDHRYSDRAPQYGVSSTLTPKRDARKCVTTFNLN